MPDLTLLIKELEKREKIVAQIKERANQLKAEALEAQKIIEETEKILGESKEKIQSHEIILDTRRR